MATAGSCVGQRRRLGAVTRTPWSWVMDATLSKYCTAPDVTRPAKVAVRMPHRRQMHSAVCTPPKVP